MKNFILSILFLGLVVSCTSTTDIVVENPPFSVGTHSEVFITEVRMNKKATFLTMSIICEPNKWYTVSSETYIIVDGEKYIVKSVDGIEFDEKIKPDKTGKSVFTLEFDAIDPEAKQLDFLESDCDKCFKIWGVELKSDVMTNCQEVPQEVKDAAIVTEDGLPLETPQFKAGNATIKGKYIGYVPDMNWVVNIQAFDPITGMEEEFGTPVMEDGSFELQVPMIIKTQVIFSSSAFSEWVLLSPDEETTVYIDLQQKSCQQARHRVDKCPESKYVYFGGANAEINNQFCDLNILRDISEHFYSEQLFSDISGMTNEKYISYIFFKMNRAKKQLERKGLTKKAHELAMINMRLKALYCLLSINSAMVSSSAMSGNNNKKDGLLEYTPPVLDESYFSFMKDFGVNRQKNLYTIDYIFLFGTLPNLVNKDIGNEAYQRLINKGVIDPEDIEIAESLIKQVFDEMTVEEKQKAAIFWRKYSDLINIEIRKAIYIRVKSYLENTLETSEGIIFDLIETQQLGFNIKNNITITEEEFKTLSKMKNRIYYDHLKEKNNQLLVQIEAGRNEKSTQ